MANYNMNYSIDKESQVNTSRVKSIKVKMPIQKSIFKKPKTDKLLNFKAYLDYAIYNLNITPKKEKSTFDPSYQRIIPPKCYCCSNTAKYSQLTCNNYDCATELFMDMSKKIYSDGKYRNILVSNRSNSHINGIYTNGISDCISHMLHNMKIKYTKNCVCCNRDIPFGLVVCRSVKCISQFLLECGEKYKKFRVEYNKKYNARKIEEEKDYEYEYEYDYEYNYGDYEYNYDCKDEYSEYSENACRYCNEGDGGSYSRGCDNCGTLSCGCIDVCRGRCESW